MPGPPRKPTALRRLQGTDKPYLMNPNEPKPKKGVPEPPDHLSERAKAAWPRVAEMLHNMGVLTIADGFALECLLESYADLVAARESLKRHEALTYESVKVTGDRMTRVHPEMRLVADADRRFRSWLASFGLTPADRARVSAVEQEKDDPWASFDVLPSRPKGKNDVC